MLADYSLCPHKEVVEGEQIKHKQKYKHVHINCTRDNKVVLLYLREHGTPYIPCSYFLWLTLYDLLWDSVEFFRDLFNGTDGVVLSGQTGMKWLIKNHASVSKILIPFAI
jgi:hypothetical protein